MSHSCPKAESGARTCHSAAVPERNVFGQPVWLKKKVFEALELPTRKWMFTANDLWATGTEHLVDLPQRGVLFVANHQTIFTDVIAMYHTFLASSYGHEQPTQPKRFVKNPRHNLYFVAAKETMQSGVLPRIMALGGAVLTERTWRHGDEMVDRSMKQDDVDAIATAIDDGWVVTFPQGTTRPDAPVRKGTAHIIKQFQPIVVPIRVDGFRDAFDKTGLKRTQKGVKLTVDVRPPLLFDHDNDSIELIVEKLTDAIAA